MGSNWFNRKIECDGYVFDSVAEHNRYQDLLNLQSGGEITDLVVHPTFELQPSFKRGKRTIRKIEYTGDFQYVEDGRVIVEDVKSKRDRRGRTFTTEAFKIRSKLFQYKYPDIEFRVVSE